MQNMSRTQIEYETRSQRLCDAWQSFRKHRSTSSNFGKICKARNSVRKQRIAKELVFPKSTSNLPVVKYGIGNEGAAIKAYLKNRHCEFAKCGLVVHPQYPYLAASPDGLLIMMEY